MRSKNKLYYTISLFVVLIFACHAVHNIVFSNVIFKVRLLIVNFNGLEEYSSIQEAINNASDGDIILVRSGVYYENLVVNKSVSIIGEDQANTIIDGGGVDIAVVVKASGAMLKNLTIQHGLVGVVFEEFTEENQVISSLIVYNSYYGIYGDRCGRNTIANNTISYNGWHGIFLYASGPCVIENNTIISNNADGVRIRYSNNTLIRNNVMSLNSGCGIYLMSDEDPERPSFLSRSNVISYNCVLNNSCGVKICHFGMDTSLAGNEVYGNYIAYNGLGLNLSGSRGNVFYNNNFVGNLRQLSVFNTFGNRWDAGYYVGGNFWSDYKGVDFFWGPNQLWIGSDGIFDVPYAISLGDLEFDRYPFKFENGWSAAVQVSILYPRDSVYRSGNLPLVLNLNKPAYLNYCLDGDLNGTIVENLILSYLAVGQHEITVCAYDFWGSNACGSVKFFVTFSEDVNCDGVVDILDVYVVAFCFGSCYGSLGWNGDADLNHDGKVNIVDVVMVARRCFH